MTVKLRVPPVGPGDHALDTYPLGRSGNTVSEFYYLYISFMPVNLHLHMGCCPVPIKNVMVNTQLFFSLLPPHNISFLIEFGKQ